MNSDEEFYQRMLGPSAGAQGRPVVGGPGGIPRGDSNGNFDETGDFMSGLNSLSLDIEQGLLDIEQSFANFFGTSSKAP